jgi:hypothetical protein
MRDTYPFVLVHQKEIISHMFYDPMACYMENYDNQDLRLRMGCQLRDEDNDKSMSKLDIGCFASVFSF